MKLKQLIITAVLFCNFTVFTQNIYNMSVVNGMLSFAGTSDYKRVIGGLTATEKLQFLDYLNANINFNSLEKNKTTPLYLKMNDDFIELLINAEGYIKIGSNIFKLDPTADKVAVVAATEFTSNMKAQMDAGNYTAISAYSMGDDVIGMVETNTPPSGARYFCGESGAGADCKSGTIPCTNPSTGAACNNMTCRVEYFRLGLYFSLKAKSVNYSPCRELVWHKTPAGYKVKCAETVAPSYQWDIRTNNVGAGGAGWVWNTYFYQNVRPLNAFWLRVVFMAKDASWIGNPDNPSVDLEIRKNM